MTTRRQTFHVLAGLCVIAFGLSTATEGMAQSRCPAGNSGCTIDNAGTRIRDTVREGARDIVTSRPSHSGVLDRTHTIRQVLTDCVTCGTDAIRDGANRITNGNGPGGR